MLTSVLEKTFDRDIGASHHNASTDDALALDVLLGMSSHVGSFPLWNLLQKERFETASGCEQNNDWS